MCYTHPFLLTFIWVVPMAFLECQSILLRWTKSCRICWLFRYYFTFISNTKTYFSRLPHCGSILFFCFIPIRHIQLFRVLCLLPTAYHVNEGRKQFSPCLSSSIIYLINSNNILQTSFLKLTNIETLYSDMALKFAILLRYCMNVFLWP